MNIRSAALILFSAFCAAALVSAHEEPKPHSGSSELETLKKLQGSWKGTMEEDGKNEPATTEFKVISMGSAVQETLGRGTPFEMVDMYVDQGGKLAMTHYCAVGNQPHMVLQKGGAKQIVLEMDKTPGIDMAKDMHMHGLTIELVDADHIVERWTSFEKGKAAKPAVFKFERVKS